MRYCNFHTAFFDTLTDVYENYQFLNAPRGYRSREKLNYRFTLIHPRERICYLPIRKTNIIFNFAEVFWYLSSSNKLDFIAYYAQGIRKYSIDGCTLTGTAYGPKIFNFGPSSVNQWDKVVRLLMHEDRDSKRAYIQIFDACEKVSLENIDVTCTLGLHFLIREEKLYLCAFMRANDVFKGMVSDVFSFTFLQELMATQMGIGLGEYYHNVGSIHLYENDYQKAAQILVESTHADRLETRFKFPQMPCQDNWHYIQVILDYEKLLRNAKIVLTLDRIEQLKLPEYWKQILMLFSFYQGIVYRQKIDKEIYENLYPIYQYLLHNKWFKNDLCKSSVEDDKVTF